MATKKRPSGSPIISPLTRIIIAIAVIGIGTSVAYLLATQSRDRSQHDIAYCGTDNIKQTLDIYTPHTTSTSPQNIPYVAYIHGGGWRGGDKVNAFTRAYVPYFLLKGVAVISIDYRLSPHATYPAQNEDIGCALTYIDTNAIKLGLDTSKSLLFGDSAGAELAAFAALNIPYEHYDYEAPKGVIDFYGVTDFSTIINAAHPDENARFYLGSKYNQVASSASPSSYVTAHAPRFLFVHGTSDTVVPLSQTTSINTSLTALGIDTELITLPGVGHAFAGPELKPATFIKIKQSLDSFISETIAK